MFLGSVFHCFRIVTSVHVDALDTVDHLGCSAEEIVYDITASISSVDWNSV